MIEHAETKTFARPDFIARSNIIGSGALLFPDADLQIGVDNRIITTNLEMR
jgi:hypothetical protein